MDNIKKEKVPKIKVIKVIKGIKSIKSSSNNKVFDNYQLLLDNLKMDVVLNKTFKIE